jgi:MFS family permease
MQSSQRLAVSLQDVDNCQLLRYLMDKHGRVKLLMACVILGEAPCLATYLVTKYWQLLATRALTGIAVGGASRNAPLNTLHADMHGPPVATSMHAQHGANSVSSPTAMLLPCCDPPHNVNNGAPAAGAAPIIFGLLSDLFPPAERPHVTTCVVVSQGAGASLGQVIAGGFPSLDWRMPFVLVSIPALLVAIVTAATTADPARGGAEPALQGVHELQGFAYDEHLTWRKVRQLCSTKTNVLAILQARNCVNLQWRSRHWSRRGLSRRRFTRREHELQCID